ncbi:toxin TcdB middle/N-terminal domain-containing protein [Treponema pedis]|uniref:YD repeat-containing protein n=1 Tax=Treponema pedis TaxID=409322 RepID=A0A7S7AXI4_9SPIR|nr:toxin TcdB middle/N-terminal domain-containing protein [Treponema pedis]QOW61186.1 hypothetical protein IFE08_01900 [Treponema pedis]
MKEGIRGIKDKAIAITVFIIYTTGIVPLNIYGEERKSNGLRISNGKEIARKVIGKEGGELEGEGVRFIVPEGAVEEGVEIRISKLIRVEDGGEIKNVTEGEGGYRFEPSGIKFKKECIVELGYDERIEEEYAEEIRTYYYNEGKRRWEELKRVRVDTERKRIISVTDHFTDMINGTLSLPESPSPVNVNLNSIKELKAADAVGGIEKIEGLNGGSEGSASFNMKLQLASGVRGFTPELAVSYSSGSGHGVLGKGFNLSGLESISIDTSLSLPRYDGKDTYLIKGIKVRYEGGQWKEGRKESYAAIKNEWVEGIGGRNYFEIREKDGSVKIYGKENWSGESEGGKYIYYLDEKRDSFGNSIKYKYGKEREGAEEEVFLEEIRYGKEEERVVRIEYEGRKDERVDGRGKYLKKSGKRIRKIESKVGSKVIRGYIFKYKENEFLESLLERIEVTGVEGQDKYEYVFEYEEVRKEGEAIKIFGETERWEKKGSIAESVHISGGGSGSGGAGISLVEVFSITGGITGSAGGGRGYSKRNFVDITGDGIADIVDWERGKIKVYEGKIGEGGEIRYEEGSFDGKAIEGKFLSENEDSNWSIGGKIDVSIKALGVSAGFTKQGSISESKSEFSDVNRDGYIDFISGGKYYENEGGKRFKEGKELGKIENVKLKVNEEEKKESEKAHYFQEGIRAWRSKVSGEIGIEVEIKNKGRGKLKVYKSASGDGKKLIECEEEKTYRVTTDIRRGEYIYFVTETDNEEEIGDSIEAAIKIEYKKYMRDELLGRYVQYAPPERLGEAPSAELKGLYDEKTETVEDDSDDGGGEYEEERVRRERRVTTNTYWELKKDYKRYINEKVIKKFIELEYYKFEGERLKKEIFEKIYNGYGAKEKVKAIVKYDEGYREYVHTGDRSGEKHKEEYDKFIKSMDKESVKELTGHEVDGKREYPLYKEDGEKYYEKKEIFSRSGEREKGKEGYENEKRIRIGKLLEKEYELRKEDGKKVLYEQGIKKSGIKVLEDKGKIQVILKEKEKSGYKSYIELRGKEEGRVISEEEYEKGILEVIERGVEYEISRVESISERVYDKIKDELSFKDGRYIKIKQLYEKGEDGYVLKEGVERESLLGVIEALLKAKEKGKIRISEKKEGEKRKREISIFTKEEAEKIGLEYFEEIEAESPWTYQIIGGLSEEEEEELYRRLKLYEGGSYDFPYFEYDKLKKEYRTTKELIRDKEEVREFLKYLNAYYYGEIELVIEYYAEGLYPVENGEIEVQKIKNGRLIVEKEKIKSYEGDENYKEGLYENEKGLAEIGRYEKLYGGLNLWYYGLYSRYGEKSFSEAKLYYETEYERMDENGAGKEKEKLEKDNKDNKDEIDKEVKKLTDDSLIGTHIPVRVYKEIKDEVRKTEKEKIDIPTKEGKSGLQFQDKSLLGTITATVKNGFNGEGKIESEVEYYAAYIEGNIMHSSRITGNSYKQLPWVKEKSERIGGGGGKFIIGRSESSSFDRNIGASGGPASANIGYNTGESEQTQGFMDINGDGYPDVLKTEGENLSVQLGDDLLSFKEKKNLKEVSLSKNENSSKVYGAGVSLSGSLNIIRDSKGKIKVAIAASGGEVLSKIPIGGNGGGNYSEGDQSQNAGLIDINGDGLPDYQNRGKSKLNIGERFVEKSLWPNAAVISEGKVTSGGGSIGLSVSIPLTDTYMGTNFGANFNISRNTTEQILTDINGDGLPDKLKSISNEDFYEAYINTGRGYSQNPIKIKATKMDNGKYKAFFLNILNTLLDYADEIKIPYKPQEKLTEFVKTKIEKALEIPQSLEFNTTRAVGMSAGLSGQAGIPAFPPLSILANFSGGGNGNYSHSEVSLRLFDIDGDGLTDRVFNIGGEESLYVQRNLLGKVGLLKKINLPQGGSYELEYERVGNTRELPQCKYVLSEVTAKSGLKTKEGNSQEYKTKYIYEGGYYNREEKEFYGFKKVKSINAIGTVTETEYYIDFYYRKGMVKEETVKNGNRIYSIKEYETDTAPHARIKKERVTQKEGSGEGITIEKEYSYDEYGNVTKLYDKGDIKDANDDITAHISYWKDGGEKYFKGHPESIQVLHGKTGILLRKREGAYDKQSGALTELKQYTSSSSYLLSRIEWTSEGNIKSVISPTGKRMEYKYLNGIYPVEIKEVSAEGEESYTSKIEWDSELGVKLKETDAAGNSMRYSYDNFARVTEVRTSYDTGETPYAKYTYITPSSSFWYTITANKIKTEREDKAVMKTIVMHDGLGRIVHTAKEGEIYIEGTEGESKTGWNISGAIAYDKAGRKIKEGMPFFYGSDLEGELKNKTSYESAEQYYEVNEFTKVRNETTYEYDDIDRPVVTILPDESKQRNEYSIDTSLQITKSIDPLGNISISKKDARGNIREVRRLDKNGSLLTKAKYEYSVLGEMLRAYDAKENIVSVGYDLLGRRISLESLDAGRKEWIYDDKGRLKAETDSVLRSKASEIRYEYDGFDRITKIDYPFSEDTEYKYGEPGEKGAGQVTYKKDESGETHYSYGELNEVIKESRTINRYEAGSGKQSASFEYEADYLGRMQKMKYPDGETVSYTYDAGGQLKGVSGEKTSSKGKAEYSYVDKILYDEHSQRVYIKYGNGVETRYKYDEKRRWLDTIETENKQNQDVFQKIKYSFDPVGNVLGYTNDASTYETTQAYKYDNLYQLISVEGESKQYKGKKYFGMSPVNIAKYKQEFNFDIIGNMMNKMSTTNLSGSRGNAYKKADLDYNLDYEYDSKYAHRLIRAGNRYYRYDGNGNITAEKDGPFSEEEEFIFTYNYDKESGVYSTDYGFGLDAPKETEQTNPQDLFAYRRNYMWNERNLLTKSSDKNYTVHYRYGEDGQRALKYTEEGRSETLYFNNFFTIHIPIYDKDNPQGLRVHKHIFVGNSRLVTAMTHTDNHGDNDEQKEKRYYYHSDHLGSAQFVTDWKGRQYEHIEYTPYGELWIEETAPGIDKLPFRFTGKELDEETGLYYYGARYLDPKYSRWLSGDPALGEYIPQAPVDDEAKKHNENLPGMGGVYNVVNLHLYHYAGNNPVKYIDPDGRSETIHTEEGREIHKKIYDMYSSAHQPEIVTGNTTSMSKALYEAGKVDGGLGKTDLGLKPDIWNMTTNEIYEIKPEAAGSKVAKNQALLYISILKKHGEGNVHLGDSKAKGTSGFFKLNDKTAVFFHSPEQGVILYSKISQPDSNPSKVKVLAATGVALYAVYKILRTAAAGAVCPPLAAVSAVAP